MSNHSCVGLKNCSKAIAIDGNHKINRLTCCFDEVFINNHETSPLQTGCTNSPLMGSYFCNQHTDKFLNLKFFEKKLRFTSNQIRSDKKGKINTNGLILHDSIEKDDKIFLLVSYEDRIPFFVTNGQVARNYRFLYSFDFLFILNLILKKDF